MLVYKNFPDDEVLDAAIVIPSYDEGGDILPTLHAWALQMTACEIRSAIYVVVNGPKRGAPEIRASNKSTHELVQSLVSANMAPVLEKQISIDQLESFDEMRQDIISAGVRICLIDLWSKKHAPKQTTVGLARDTGFREACKQVTDDGMLIGTDADTVPRIAYLRNAWVHLEADPQLAGLTGMVHHLFSREDLNNDAVVQLRIQLANYSSIVQQALALYSGFQKPKRHLHFSGSNTVVRKSVYEVVGGMPHLNGAEDTELSRKILRAGWKIEALGVRLRMNTSCRPSERASEGHGLGHYYKELQDHCDRPWDTPVISIEAQWLITSILSFIAHINRYHGRTPTQWKFALREQLQRLPMTFSDEDVEHLWKLNENDPELEAVEMNRILLVGVEKFVVEKGGMVPLAQAFQELNQYIYDAEEACGDPISFQTFSFSQKNAEVFYEDCFLTDWRLGELFAARTQKREEGESAGEESHDKPQKEGVVKAFMKKVTELLQ